MHLKMLVFSPLVLALLAPPTATPVAAPDPFAVTQACTKLLARVVTCGGERGFKKVLAQWAATPELALTGKQVQERLRAWAKPDGRRTQCAIWTGREGAAEHIGDQSPSAKIVENKQATCLELGRELDRTRWLPRAMAQDP